MNSKVIAIIVAIALLILLSQSPSLAANALLHPMRRQISQAHPSVCKDISFIANKNINLKGWECEAKINNQTNIGTIIYLHGVADNRSVATGVIQRFTAMGFKVIAYDSRAHGESDGENCTYGYYEKADLRVVLNTITAKPIILMGNSMGAAVALQAAENDARISGSVTKLLKQ